MEVFSRVFYLYIFQKPYFIKAALNASSTFCGTFKCDVFGYLGIFHLPTTHILATSVVQFKRGKHNVLTYLLLITRGVSCDVTIHKNIALQQAIGPIRVALRACSFCPECAPLLWRGLPLLRSEHTLRARLEWAHC